MSDHEDTDEEADSVFSVYTDLMKQVEALLQVLETAEVGLAALQRPMEQLTLHQLGSIPFLETSPFRTESFLLKNRATGSRTPFHKICAELRTHCLALPTEGPEGAMVTSPFLRDGLGIKSRLVTFPTLFGALTHGLL